MADSEKVLENIEKYEKKLHSSFFEDWDLEKYPFAYIAADGSVFVYRVDPDAIDIGPSSGRMDIMLARAKSIAHMVGLHKLRTGTIHNPEAFSRLCGGHVVKETRFNDAPTEYIFELEV